MRNIVISFFIISLLVSSGCASSGSGQPDWINGNSSKYPAAQYLIGKGEDNHQAVARDRARADLAKVFEIQIQEQSEDSVSSNSQTENGKTDLKLEASASRSISTRTDQIISGIEIAETWQDSNNKQFHVLAVLERIKAGKNLRDTINQLDDVTAQAIRRAQQNDNLLQKIGLAHAALQAQIERAVFNKQLKMINNDGLGLSSDYNIITLANDRNALLKRMRVRSQFTTDLSGGLEDMLSASVSSAGFYPVSNGKADYLLDARLVLNESRDAQGWYWQRGTLEINLSQTSNQQAQGSKRWNIKESSQDRAVSQKRVFDKIDKILKNELRQTIIGFGSTE